MVNAFRWMIFVIGLAVVIGSIMIASAEDAIITINSPSDGDTVNTKTITVSGTVVGDQGAVIESVTVNGKLASGTGPEGGFSSWEIKISLREGQNKITVEATDIFDHKTPKTITMIYNAPTPSPPHITTPTPTLTPTPTPTPSLQESIDEKIKKLPKGRILFNPPKEMKVRETELVEVRITKSMTEELTRDLKGRGDPIIEEINVSTSMNVRLTGINFDIEPQNGAAQAIESDKFTKWVFYVTPLKSGIQTLYITVYAIISIPGYDDKEKEYEVEDWEINVKVNPIWFLKCNWQFIVGTLIAIVSLIIAAISIRKKKG